MTLAGGTHLRYVIEEPSPYGNREKGIDLASAPAYQLFFSYFVGDVELVIDGADFRTRFGWVSTLSFAIGMLHTVRDLPGHGASQAEFLESEDWIRFRLERSVQVSCSYANAVAMIDYEELEALVEQGLVSLLDELYSNHPRLVDNPFLTEQLTFLGMKS